MEFNFSNYIIYDSLSLYFVSIVILIFIPIAIYSIGYIKEYKNHYSILYFWLMMIAFVLSMIGVLLANSCVSFLVFWELMSIFSFFLVIYEHKKKENIKTGIMYFVMTHISGLFLIIMFALICKNTSTTIFNYMIENLKNISTSQKSIILVLGLFGFGAKAGLVPLHAWLPKAHPSAPSNISALMSGVMLKIAVYGFIRILYLFSWQVPVEFSIIVMITGTFTAIFSIYNALLQKDIKKLLAYSSSENIGIIFATLGLSLLLFNYGLKQISILALIAALFHSLNHAIFKSLLFASAGSVLYSTSTKNMNELGGLYKKMKFTTYCAFIGTAAIAAIPPLNGFASEILILKSFIQSIIKIINPQVVLIIMFCGITLSITSGLIIWSAIKNFSMTFLGNPRTQKAINTNAIPLSMNIGMGILASYTILFGVLSPIVIKYISGIANVLTNVKSTVAITEPSFEITIISCILILVSGIIYLVNKFSSKNEVVETNITWGCGFNESLPYMQYSANGFSQPAAKFAGIIAGYKKEVKIKETIYLNQKLSDIFEDRIYSSIIKVFDYLAIKVIKIHYGRIQIYISYIFISLIFAIVLVIKFV